MRGERQRGEQSEADIRVKVEPRTNVCRRTRMGECARAVGSLEVRSAVDARWAASKRSAMGSGGDEGGTLVGGQSTHSAQGWLVAVGASQPFDALGLDALGLGGRRSAG